MPNPYKFYIYDGATDTEVTPLEYPNIEWRKDGDRYKREDVNVEFTGADYDLIHGFGTCYNSYLRIVRQSDSSEQFYGKVFIRSVDEKTKLIKIKAKENTFLDEIDANSDININIFAQSKLTDYVVEGSAELTIDSTYYQVLFPAYDPNDVFQIDNEKIIVSSPVNYAQLNISLSQSMDIKISMYSESDVLLYQSINVGSLFDVTFGLVPTNSYITIELLTTGIVGSLIVTSEVTANADISTLAIDTVILESGTPFPNESSYRKFASAITISTVDYDIYFAYVSRTRISTDWTLISGLYYLPYDATAATPTFTSVLVATAKGASEFYIGSNTGDTHYVVCPITSLEYPNSATTEFTLNGQLYTNGVFLRDVINQAIQLIDLSLYCVSSFLFGDSVETGSTWTNSETGGFNLGTILMFKAIDIKSPNNAIKATTAYTTLSEILNALKVYNCYSFVDSDGFYRIEHISYKFSTNTIDLRTVYAQKGILCVDELQTIEYTTENEESSIIFKPAVPTVGTFAQTGIVYKGDCLDTTKTKTIQMNSFILDYSQVIAQDEDITDSSIVIITKNILNFPDNKLSFGNAAYYYYRHEANYQFYDIPSLGEVDREAITLTRNVSLESVNYPEPSNEFDIKDNYKTFYKGGSVLGVLENANINTITGNVELNLLFEK